MGNIRKDDEQILDRILESTDYFSVLGLKHTCSEKEVTQAYRKLAKKVHPDKNKTTRAHEAFVALQEANDTLKDKEKRQTYIKQLHATSQRSTSNGQRRADTESTSNGQRRADTESTSNGQRRADTESTFNGQRRADTESTRQRTHTPFTRETHENNTYPFRQQNTQFISFSRRFWICLLAGLLFLFFLWVIPELNHTSPRKTPKQSSTSISSSEIFELWKTEIFNVKMITKKLKIPFYVERGYHPKSGVELLDLWERVEKASSIN